MLTAKLRACPPTPARLIETVRCGNVSETPSHMLQHSEIGGKDCSKDLCAAVAPYVE